MKAIVVSEKDPAGKNIYEHLLEKGFDSTSGKWQGKTVYKERNWLLVLTDSRIIYAKEAGTLNADEIIFASKHSSESGKPTLTTHPPGNFGPADYGGEPGKLCQVNANRMNELHSHLLKPTFEYEVSLEVTHHGPYIRQPCCFIELGSTEKQWENQEAANYIAKAIMKTIKKEKNTKKDIETAIGIGGNHYAKKFNEIQEDEEIAMGHIIPRYAQKHLNKEMVQQMIEKTHPEPNRIYIDKKGTRKQAKVRKMLKDFDKEIILL